MSTACAAISCAQAQQNCARMDFNGDNRSDVLWRHQGAGATGENYLYFMNGLAIDPEGHTRAVPDQGWQVAGIGDFDGNGTADILWRNNSTGANYIYFMNGLAILPAEGYIRTVLAPWSVAGLGDFDGDGKTDILWRNTSTGENYIHFMDGLAILPAEGYIRSVADQNWIVAGVGDFDGDGKADVLWRNSVSGENYLYPMDGKTINPTEGYLRSVADQAWTIAGLGDFNGDRQADILWRNTSDGQNYVYFMSGTTISAEGYIRSVPDQAWQVRATNDYDGNGKADIHWRNAGSGENYVYFMDGLTIAAEGNTRTVSDQAWQTAVPSRTAFTTACGITATIAPNRTSGVAPLYVFFDTTGTTATGVTRPFHDLEYRWDFGDPSGSPVSGTAWWNGARPGARNSRNSATGPVAAHVFERPGTYTVKLSVTSGGNTVSTTAQITVQDPDDVASLSGANVIYVSTDGVFPAGEVPANATKVTTSSFVTAMGNLSSTKNRILFKRGQKWAGGEYNLSLAGPGIVGAWGSGERPIVEVTTSISNALSHSSSDWRIMDLDIRRVSGGADAGVNFYNNGDRILYLRTRIHGFPENWLVNPYVLSGGDHLFQDIAFVDGTLSGSTIRNTYSAGRRFSLLGNDFGASGDSHTIRLHQMWDGVIQHNTFAGGSSVAHLLKLHAPCRSGDCDVLSVLGTSTFSENIVISDNLYDNDDSPWIVSIAPQNNLSDERVRNVISERNVYRTKSGIGSIGLRIDARLFTVRNELIDLSNGDGNVVGVSITTDGIVPAPTNVSIYNNTVYRANSASSFAIVGIGGGATNTTVKNNLGRAPNVSNPTAVSGGGTGLVASNNSTGGSGGQIRGSNPFVVGSPVAVEDFRPRAGGYARNGGTPAPVYSDLLRQSRPKEAAIDIGAFEFVP